MTINYPARHDELQGQMVKLGHELSAVMSGFASLHKSATAKGALDTKTKELIALGIAIAIRCESCISFHVHDALKAGATHADVIETIGVAVMMGGGPAAMYACDAFTALQQFESKAI